ncbi:ComF family protein [Microbulbifer hydrolyticus]|uniref:ComF family protein n=1 Tax=Microbulbifer hydrolyticus TaxID=48074 RepID=A0A6P1T8C4_9GAMM|nr:ComF family protein [Microbulbifer hydrolyticus]MBB5211341.1 ComF family protein [Microbulbifer hydrolyticus]QHQ37900.1 ComF family protein [Microbulbifer hydrolyticus]
MTLRLLERLWEHSIGRTIDARLAVCILCRSDEHIRAGICAPCEAELPALEHACTTCALPLPNPADRQCPRCQQKPPPQCRSRACWYYAYPVAQLIQRFKYQGDLAAGRTLAELAALRFQPEAHRPDILVPVPLHWRKQISRGYNQAQLIADRLGRQWHIPVHTGALRKVTPTGSQQELRRSERLKNLADSFTARPDKVAGLHVGLVDDVITTGATLEVAAQALCTAGATRVSAYALARTP